MALFLWAKLPETMTCQDAWMGGSLVVETWGALAAWETCLEGETLACEEGTSSQEGATWAVLEVDHICL